MFTRAINDAQIESRALPFFQLDIGHARQLEVAGGIYTKCQAETARYECYRGDHVVNVLDHLGFDIEVVEEAQQIVAEPACATSTGIKDQRFVGEITKADPASRCERVVAGCRDQHSLVDHRLPVQVWMIDEKAVEADQDTALLQRFDLGLAVHVVQDHFDLRITLTKRQYDTRDDIQDCRSKNGDIKSPEQAAANQAGAFTSLFEQAKDVLGFCRQSDTAAQLGLW